MKLISNTSLGSYIGLIAQRYKDRPAVEYMANTWTYTEMWEQSSLVAKGMIALGIRRGTHVGIWANDRPNTLFCMLALLRIGAVCVMLSTSLPKLELEKRLSSTDTSHLLFDNGYKDTDFKTICADITLPVPGHRISIDTVDCPGFISLQELIDLGIRISHNELSKYEAAVTDKCTDFLLFTSGSTSTPRAVQTTHYSRLNTALIQAASLQADETDRYCISMPMFHCFSLTGTVLAALCTGACVCFPKDRRTRTLLTLIQESRCTIFSGVPTLFSALLARKDFDTWDLSSLRTGMIGGSSYPPKVFQEICSRFNYTLLSSMGQTEATAGYTSSSINDPMDIRSQTVGKFWDNVEGRIVDPNTGEDVPHGTSGEIWIRGFNVMEGYYNDTDLTSQILTHDGWLKTGDLALQDNDGNLYLSGRLKEVIIRGGENISPGEIEMVLSEHPSVQKVKVIGIPDPHYGEEICALVVKDSTVSENELQDLICCQLESFKSPRYFICTDELPMTLSGKVDISACKQLAINHIGKNNIHNGEKYEN